MSLVAAGPSPLFAQANSGDVSFPSEAGGRSKLYDKSYALVIGINDYRNGWPHLNRAIPDAKAVATTLGALGFEVSLKENLDGKDLKETLQSWFLFAGMQPNARLLVWFAGHGETVKAGTYLIPADAPNPTNAGANDSSVLAEFFRDSVPISEFNRFMREATARHVIVVFDACFAGEIFSARRSAPPSISRASRLPARQFITSGIAGQTVSDDGKFAELFIKAITDPKAGADQNKDGYVTGNELGVFLHDVFSDQTRNKQTPDFGPLREGDFDKGDFVFALPSLDDAAQTAVNPDRDVALHERVWIFVRDLKDPKITQSFLQSFPDSPYAKIASAQIEALTNPEKVVGTKADAEKHVMTFQKPDVRVVPVLFGTNRASEGGRFGSAMTSSLSIGEAMVSVPQGHQIGQIETASNVSILGLTVYQESVSTAKHFSILSSQTFSSSELAARNGEKSPQDDVLIFVHGFNTPFELALFRGAQIVWDTSFAGSAAVFSWPSQASVSSYLQDREAALASRGALGAFIKAVKASHHGRIHIVAQSQGAVPVMAALEDLARENVGSSVPIDQVVLLSPDMDKDAFLQTCDLSSKAARKITIYASGADKALQAAATVSKSPRIGSIGQDGIPFLSPCAEFIDASKAGSDSDFGLHTTYSSNPVLNDIALLLKSSSPSPRLAEILKVDSPSGTYFRFRN